MPAQPTVPEAATPADGLFQIETLAVRWSLTALYVVLSYTGVIDIGPGWFAISAGFIVGWHLYYTWYTWHEMTQEPLPARMAFITPFFDTLAVTLALIAVGDALHPIWAVNFLIMVAVAYFYHEVILPYAAFALASYGFVALALQFRGIDVSTGAMVVAGVLLLVGMINLVSYTRGERRLRGRISEVALTDPLTRLRNRRGLEEALTQHLASHHVGRQLSVLMIDVDRFKRYNDQFGHLAADGVLEQLGQVLTATSREGDLVARYGGDEFVILLVDVTEDEAVRMAERLRKQMSRLGLCTVSIGVSIATGGEDAKELIDMADAALIAAKQAGRNCVRGPFVRARTAA